MKILIYGLNFAPELVGIGKYTGEMATWLSRHGHEVRVVTAPPYYPEWRIQGNYRSWKYSRESQGAIKVVRCPVWVPTSPSGVKRLVHLASYAISSLPVVLTSALWRPNIVLVIAPALFCAPGAWLCARIGGAKSWLHVQDFEVDAAFDLGLLSGEWLRRIVTMIERTIVHRFDVVSTISESMLAKARAKAGQRTRAVLFRNWVDVSSIDPRCRSSAFRERLGISPTMVMALYSGNMGAKQGLENLAEAARLLESMEKVVFVFCGSGSGREDLVERCKGLKGVRFLDLQPAERLGEMLTAADIHLLPQRADIAESVMPSKLVGMLASGRPMIATTVEGSELARIVNRCGLTVRPGDTKALSESIVLLAGDAGLRTRLGGQARRYAESHLDCDVVLGEIEGVMRGLVS